LEKEQVIRRKEAHKKKYGKKRIGVPPLPTIKTLRNS
jgi:hypothetical protein